MESPLLTSWEYVARVVGTPESSLRRYMESVPAPGATCTAYPFATTLVLLLAFEIASVYPSGGLVTIVTYTSASP